MERDVLSATFVALSDPTRRAILRRLRAGDANVTDLTVPFNMSQPAVSRHLRVLRDAGLISQYPSATSTLSHLEARPLKSAVAWMQTYREFWDRSFDRLDELSQRLSTDTPHAGEAS